jgi:hypothetical protein
MNQATQSLNRMLAGKWTPDPAAVAYTYEDGSHLVKNPELAERGQWITFRKSTKAEVAEMNRKLSGRG